MSSADVHQKMGWKEPTEKDEKSPEVVLKHPMSSELRPVKSALTRLA